MRVDWCVEDEQRRELEPHLEFALKLLPPWVQSVAVRYDPSEDGLASVSVLPEYRTVSVRVGNGWFSDTRAEKRIALAHEVLHAHAEGLAVVFEDLLEAALPEDDALKRWAREQWRRAEEAFCSDLSRAVSSL